MADENSVHVYRNDAGELRIRVDAPGERAVSAPFDAQALIAEIQKQAMTERVELKDSDA